MSGAFTEIFMRIIFCADPLNPRQPDTLYEREAVVAGQNHLGFDLVNFEALVYENNPTTAIKQLSRSEALETAVYRGWMLKPPHYQQLYEALLERNIQLINTPDAYR